MVDARFMIFLKNVVTLNAFSFAKRLESGEYHVFSFWPALLECENRAFYDFHISIVHLSSSGSPTPNWDMQPWPLCASC
jgi:hypothetical protein